VHTWSVIENKNVEILYFSPARLGCLSWFPLSFTAAWFVGLTMTSKGRKPTAAELPPACPLTPRAAAETTPRLDRTQGKITHYSEFE